MLEECRGSKQLIVRNYGKSSLIFRLENSRKPTRLLFSRTFETQLIKIIGKVGNIAKKDLRNVLYIKPGNITHKFV